MKIVFLDADTLGHIDYSPIEALGQTVVYNLTAPDQIVERCAGASIVIANKVRMGDAEFSRLPGLELVCVAATGTDNIDPEAAARHGVQVKNVTDYSTRSVAQHTLACVLSLMHGICYYDHYVKGGGYTRCAMFTHHGPRFHELADMRWGIIGMGNIGKRVASIAQAFGAEVVYYSTSGRNTHVGEYEALPLEGLLSTSDVVSVHAPLNDATRGLIGDSQLRLMKPSAVIANMARGGIVDEASLARALDEGVIAGAAVDVFTNEPIAADNPLLHTNEPHRLILTPHIAWASVEARRTLVAGLVRNIVEFCK